MTKELFLDILKDGLKDFHESELSDILYDYKEHFDIGFAAGKSEEAIIEELGNPYDIVNQYRYGYLKKYDKSFEENSNFSETNDKKENYNNNSNYDKHNGTNKKTNNLIITLIIVAISLIIFGPISASIIIVIVSIIASLLIASFSGTIIGIGILLGKVVTNTLGIFVFPSFILDFPNSVIALMVLGCILAFIFLLLCCYYFIKLCISLLKNIINWLSQKI